MKPGLSPISSLIQTCNPQSTGRRVATFATCFALALTSLPAPSVAQSDRSTLSRGSRSPANSQGSFGITTTAVPDVFLGSSRYVRLQLDSQFPGSSMQAGPVRTGDSIIAVNDRLFTSKDEFVAYVRSLSPGSIAAIDYMEEATGRQFSMKATVTHTSLVTTPINVPAPAAPTLEVYLARAAQGDGAAALKAANLIGRHDAATITANLDRLVPLWQIAADQNYPDAIAAIGILMAEGLGGYRRNAAGSAELLRVAASGGSQIAINRLAHENQAQQEVAERESTGNAWLGLALIGAVILIASRWSLGGSSSPDNGGSASSSETTVRTVPQWNGEQPARNEPSPSYTAPIGGERGFYGSAHGVGD